jgi:predicted lipoprotein
MAGRASWFLLAGMGCAGGVIDTGELPVSALTIELLGQVGPGVVLPTLERFALALDGLDGALVDLSLVEGVDGVERGAAQAAWSTAMAVWQELELLQIGPAGSSLSVIAGADLADEIYSWPTASHCRVDQVTADVAYAEPDFFSANLVTAYGLDALEIALFAGPETDCPATVPPVSDGAWSALGEGGVASHRAALAARLAEGVRDQAEVLRSAWDEGGFGDELALGIGSPYADASQALEAVFGGLFYLELVTKDLKLAEEGEPEHPLSGDAHVAIAANLVGFEALFVGGDGVGFDDLLDDVGHGDLATQILDDVAAAKLIATAEAPDRVEIHAAVKKITDAIKVDLVTILSLQLPEEASGDND